MKSTSTKTFWKQVKNQFYQLQLAAMPNHYILAGRLAKCDTYGDFNLIWLLIQYITKLKRKPHFHTVWIALQTSPPAFRKEQFEIEINLHWFLWINGSNKSSNFFQIQNYIFRPAISKFTLSSLSLEFSSSSTTNRELLSQFSICP